MSLLDESPPPSYDSIYGQLKEARHTTDGNVSFAKRGFTIIIGSRSLYLHDCPAQRYIPIYLIVAGVFSLVKDLSSLLQKCKAKRTEEEQEGGAPTNFFDGLVGCFLFAWFICGNVWIYSTHNHFSTDSTKADFCEPIVISSHLINILDMDAPPSYNSLYCKIIEAKVTSGGNVDFARKSIGIVCNSVIATVFLVVFLAVPIAAIVIGGLYLHDCPKQKYIPIYLIVFGAFAIVKALLSLGDKCRASNNAGEQEESKPKGACDAIIGLFLCIWFILGNYWVYTTYKHFSTDESSDEYCQPTLFYFSFWLITGTHIVTGLIILLCCGCCISMVCCSNKPSYDSFSEYGV
ncbi:Hypothetical predicted protein [Mytilus galloprovincialis]|uniref:Uncharacterized protein n=1 Tax=Mytilus galloprovincialis TaxID=29158 RepID=A0A8B6BTJ5_MYTGA|nr:Hypothetical predicted protein [Mytilus galloprovincialis]